MEISEWKDLLRQGGVAGAGGAGFPTYAKLDERIGTVILNCAECEPLLRLHRQLLFEHAAEITEAFSEIAAVSGAGEAIIGIKKSYRKTIKALEQCIGQYPGMRLGLLDEVYPAGDEAVLIYEVTGKSVIPGGLPVESGVAVFNVETVYNAYRVVHDRKPVTDKLVTIVGEVPHPVTVRVPIGCSIEETVGFAGGTSLENPVYVIGGAMMGFIGNGAMPVTKTTNAVLVLPEDHLIVQRKQNRASRELKRAAAACCQCSMCTDLCPRHLLGHPIEPHKFMRAAACKDIQDPGIFVNTLFCSSCGLCEMYSCMQGLSPRSLMAEYKTGLKAGGVKAPAGVQAASVGEERAYRKVPMERLTARLGLTVYNTEAPLQDRRMPVKKVKILVSQHIGVPAVPCVSSGELVREGQKIAEPASGLSVAIHASIDGKVVEVTDKYVIIEKQEGRVQDE